MKSKDEEILARFKPGQTVNGFKLERAEPLPKMRIAALEFRHLKSGARLLHLAADDPENLFAVAFRTPPPDDTGLPHILEHSVLCGSKHYPVKDPFVELLKTSLATFLNAMTWPDRTVYPCASMNPKDFHNLMRVYCDAVFFPLLTEDHFRQEGHHLVFLPDGRAAIKGVVYNEMKGVYSDPEGILDRHIQRILFESNAYGRDYGGDPRCIPDLTYQQYLNFHRDYYHPSNAWLFTYGDVDPESTLEIIDQEYLSGFNEMRLDTTIQPLAAWKEPRRESFTYPLDAADSTAGKTDVALAFATNDRRDFLSTLAMQIVDVYLLDNAASPLRKALIDSKLGEELGGSGYAAHQRDTYFVVALKGSEPDRADAIEKLCIDVLEKECANGFDRDMVESALRRLELAAREIRPQYPLRLMERVFGAWLYDSDPLAQVDISDTLDELRRSISSDKGFLERLTRKYLIDNPHRLRITLVPDKSYMEKSERETAAELDNLLKGMSAEQCRAALEAAERLEKSQSEGNSEAALATLPRLAKSDVSPSPLPLDYTVEQAGGRDFLHVPMYAGGIAYLNLCLQLGELSADEIDLLPFLCEALGKTGAAGLDYAEMAIREASATGALEFSAGLTSHIEGHDKASLKLGVWLKALDSDWEKALDIMSDRLFKADFSDRNRLRDIVLQSRVAWRNQIVPSGNAYASLYASRSLTPAFAMSERLTGCSQARYMDKLAADIDNRLADLPDRLAALRDKLLTAAVPTAAQIGGDDTVKAGHAWLAANASRFGGSVPGKLPPQTAAADRVGLAVPADVAFAALSLPGPSLTDPDAPALVLLGVQLSFGYLWNEVRVKGGAYGVRAGFDAARGAFAFSSFRDPNVMNTLKTFGSVPKYVADTMDLSPAALEQSIIGAIKTLDQPMRPPSAVVTALGRHLGGDTEEYRREFRERLLGLDADAVRGAAERVFSRIAQAPVCALSSREKLTEENRSAGDKALVIEPLWESGE